MENKGKWSKFKTYGIVDGKPRKVIIDICGDVIDNDPTDEELKQIKKYPGNGSRDIFKLQEKERKIYLLEFIRQFNIKEGRVPEQMDFNKNPKYPHFHIYQNVFGSWNNVIRTAGLKPNWGGKNAKICTDEELLMYLIQFYEENGMSPTQKDFNKNSKYPSIAPYIDRFGRWQKALRTIGLDIDSMVRKGFIETNHQKARLGEIFVIDHFEEIGYIDLSGDNRKSSCDGICPKGYSYDVKTSYFDGIYWTFHLKNVNIDKIEWFYLLAFNEDYTKLLYAWRIPTLDIAEYMGKVIQIGSNNNHINNIENLKEYNITDKIKPILEKWKNSLRRWTKEEILADARTKLKVYVESKNLI